MNPELSQLAEEYARALESYLGGRGEAALQEAYDLGRKTLAKGLGVLDIATIQHRALSRASASSTSPRSSTARCCSAW